MRKIDWNQITKENGFDCCRKMLVNFYVKQGLSSTQIGEKLKIHRATIIGKLKSLEITVRKCGTVNPYYRG